MMFPSPYGDIFLKLTMIAFTVADEKKFPSPYGDIFLKFE